VTVAVSRDTGQQSRSPRRSFWILTLVAVAAAGSMSAALAAPAGALTGLWVAVSGLVLVAAVALASRVAVAVEHARRRGGR
jgi:uncharacterized membrane protein YhaH (DUF805 family)